MTLEGCLVRLCDTIGYIGRDIEDAIELKLIGREEIPAESANILGDTNGSIVYRLVTDLIVNGCEEDRLHFTPEVGGALARLKRFNYEKIYLNSVIKKGFEEIRGCYRALFESFLEDLVRERRQSSIFAGYLERQPAEYLDESPPAAVVRDFIAGMTDDFFLARAGELGCRIPVKITAPVA